MEANPIPAPEAAYHTLTLDELERTLHTNVDGGLRSTQFSELQRIHGPNELSARAPSPRWIKFLGQFNQLIIWILVAGAIISGLLGEWGEAIAILSIVLLNGILCFLQEEKAERSLSALKKLSAPRAKVIRDGIAEDIAARDLVPGDFIELEAGDHIPADARLVHTFGLRVNESALTGESVPVSKDPKATLGASCTLPDRRNMIYSGTAIVAGHTSALVVATGMRTELGKIAGLLSSEPTEITPLQKRLKELGSVLVFSCLGIVAVIFTLQLLRGEEFVKVLIFSISLAVAAVPEGLPAVVTVALALGVQRMVKRNALVRRLPSVETLGCVTVICSDKTGTLTRNEMTVREIQIANHRYQVDGIGYDPKGTFERVDQPNSEVDAKQDRGLSLLLTIGAYCNHARFSPPSSERPQPGIIGDPTEGALIVAAMKAGIIIGERQLIHEIPFDSERKRMSIVTQDPAGQIHLFSKGAAESVLSTCRSEWYNGEIRPLTEARIHELLDEAGQMASHALRVMAFAYRNHSGGEPIEQELTFVGLAGMMDPPREEVREAIQKCRTAGIRPVVITGDHPQTALAIAKELRIAEPEANAVTGSELEQMNDDALAKIALRANVFARVSPEHKLRLVRALKKSGEIVAMTGDGVNDAPAVKAADIGIAMGLTGTDVTKEASDMVLTDDNFASIVNAVEEGRGIFDNIQKFVHYLLACNASEILLVFVAAVVGWPPPLLAIQILWINLVTDGPPAMALAMERPEPDIMQRSPRPPSEAFFTRGRTLHLLLHGCLVAASGIFTFWWFHAGSNASAQQITHAQAAAFSVSAYAQLFFSFACRSHRFTLPHLGLFTNPFLVVGIGASVLLQTCIILVPWAQQIFFKSAIHLTSDFPLILGISLAPVTLVELWKIGRLLFLQISPAR